MLVNKVTKMHYLFSFLLFISVAILFIHLSLSLLSLKYISPLHVGLTSRMSNIFHFTSCLHCFLLSHCRLIFWLETYSIATYRWFVYQNIDLFSLYMSMLTSTLLGLLWRTIIILTPTSPWSSWWQQEGQEGAGAVCVWGFLCLIGSVGLHVSCVGLYYWSLWDWLFPASKEFLVEWNSLWLGCPFFLIHCTSPTSEDKKGYLSSLWPQDTCLIVQAREESAAVKRTNNIS